MQTVTSARKARGAHYTYIGCDASIFRDGPAFLFLDRWVTGTRLGPHINQPPHAEFITTCLPCYTLSLIQPSLYPDGSISYNVQSCLSNTFVKTQTHTKKVESASISAHHPLVPRFGEGLFVRDVPLHPAVGHHVAGDGGVVDCQRAFPAHHQGRLVQRLDLHAHRGAAAHWERKPTDVWLFLW